jgi:hypothetical protein
MRALLDLIDKLRGASSSLSLTFAGTPCPAIADIGRNVAEMFPATWMPYHASGNDGWVTFHMFDHGRSSLEAPYVDVTVVGVQRPAMWEAVPVDVRVDAQRAAGTWVIECSSVQRAAAAADERRAVVAL